MSLLVSSIPGLVGMTDRSGFISIAGRSIATLFGHDPEGWVGTAIPHLVVPVDGPAVASAFDKAAQQPGVDHCVHASVDRPDGSRCHVEFTMRGDAEHFDRPAVFVSAVETGRSGEVQEELRQSEARFRVLLEQINDMITVVGRDGTLTFHYPPEQLGYVEGENLGKEILSFVHPDDRPLAEETLARAFVTPGMTGPIEVRIEDKEGGWHWYEIVGNNLFDDPDVDGLVLLSRDVSDRKATEDALAANARHQEVVADLGRRALEHLDLRSLTAQATAAITAGLGADQSALFARLSEGPLVLTAGVGWPWELIGHATMGVDEGTLGGMLLASEGPICIDELRQAGVAIPEFLEETGVRSAVGSIVGGRQQPSGVLVAFSRTPGAFTNHHVGFLESTANLLGVSIERQNVEDELRHKALHDHLTGLPNRMLLLDRLRAALARSRRHRYTDAVFFVDIDRFKEINDGLGHAAGDLALAIVSERLARAVRPGDTVARFAGDEFVIFCEDIEDESEAVAMAERLSNTFSTPLTIDDREVFLTASVGVAMAQNGDATPEELIRNADAAVYAAKDLGRARYALFDERLQDRAAARIAKGAELRHALERNEFRLAFQPVVRPSDGVPEAFEALVRWQHPDGRLRVAEDFVPFAEETGLIVPIGAWIVREACAQASALGSDPSPSVAVNVSARELANPEIVTLFDHSIRAGGLDPTLVWLEISEAAVMTDNPESAATLDALRALGVQLAIDDFGTGYSSLERLRRLPVSIVKIDRALIDGLGSDDGDTAIVEAIVQLAHTLGMRVVAEGVETAVQADRLRDVGCDLGQGYYYGHPNPLPNV